MEMAKQITSTLPNLIVGGRVIKQGGWYFTTNLYIGGGGDNK